MIKKYSYIFSSYGIDLFIGLPRAHKRIIVLLLDLVIVPFALWLSFSLRLDEIYKPTLEQLWIFVAAPLLAIPIFIRFGLYRAIIRYIGLKALWSMIKAIGLYSLFWSLLVMVSGLAFVPRSVFFINFIMVIILVGSSRMTARWLFSTILYVDLQNKSLRRVAIYGAGSAGMQLAMILSAGNELRPVAFLDDDTNLHDQLINGLRVFSFQKLTYLIEKMGVEEVLLALPKITKNRRKEIISLLEPYRVSVKTIPNVTEIAQSNVKVSDIREVEIGDLLGRGAVPANYKLLHANIHGKIVLVTGAGGSIGSELCRQIVQLKPKKLILLEQNEFQLYSIEKNLLDNLPQKETKIIPILGSVTDAMRNEEVCSAFHVQTIYHAAAYKHVPLVEKNPGEAIRNNIFGTLYMALAAIKTGVETFVLISTDKAVRPTNTMGATKRFAELILQAFSQDPELYQKTRFTMVRFGNVLGSSGSVVPLFREQIATGGPLTVTDSNIIRYFMTIQEASELVIQAGAMGTGGDVFVLDMGDPVRIVDLANKMIKLSGFTVKDKNNPDGDIEIKITGLRPGEKLYEELLIGENVSPTEHSKIMRAREDVILWPELEMMIEHIQQVLEENDYESVRKIFRKAVAGFNPQCEIADEVQNAIIEDSNYFKD